MKIELNVEIPEGYEATGEYRVAVADDLFLTADTSEVVLARYPIRRNVIILRKILSHGTIELIAEVERLQKMVEKMECCGNCQHIYESICCNNCRIQLNEAGRPMETCASHVCYKWESGE
jgi:hypothetical protein